MTKRLKDGVLSNSKPNHQMLAYARDVLDENRFIKLFGSYKQQVWFQLSYLVFSIILLVSIAIILRDRLDVVLLIFAVVIVFGLVIVMIVKQFFVGRLWQRYVNWYNKGCPGSELDDIFN